MAALPAQATSLRRVRALLRDWLAEQSWPVTVAEDVELAVNEAVSNVIDHAYPPEHPGSATLHAWVSIEPRTGTRRVVAAVLDRGRWATHHPDIHPPSARGHGLVVMNGCMAELHIQRSAAGTTVIMISESVPPSTATVPPTANPSGS
jgi:anti-sigma regulatory factor (Ser/Thr protein kinase)